MFFGEKISVSESGDSRRVPKKDGWGKRFAREDSSYGNFIYQI
jgi:hypothetical protein